MWDAVRADAQRYFDYVGDPSPRTVVLYLRSQSTWALLELRLYQWLHSGDCPRPLSLALRPLSFALQIVVECVTGISIEHGARIGRGFYIGHFGGIVIGGGVTIGDGCNISQGVTIGVAGRGDRRGSPTIGDRVYIGPGAKVFGDITVGDGAKIGANAVVSKDVPAGATARAPHAELVVEQP